MTSRATQAELLEQRISENRSAQEVDLVTHLTAVAAGQSNDEEPDPPARLDGIQDAG
mgnify:CR=1 FL=1